MKISPLPGSVLSENQQFFDPFILKAAPKPVGFANPPDQGQRFFDPSTYRFFLSFRHYQVIEKRLLKEVKTRESFGMFWSFLRGENQSADEMIEVVDSRLRIILKTVISLVNVDENYYLKNNPDVNYKVNIGEFKSAKDHYISNGYFEDRFPYAISIDETWYIESYPDVADAIRLGKFVSARQHFELHGFREGRLPSANWSLISNN